MASRYPFTRTVEMIYRAVEEPALWEEAMRALAGGQAASAVTLATFETGNPRPDIFVTPGFTPEAQKLYDDYYVAVDPWVPIWSGAATGAALLGQDLLSMEDYERSEIWWDFSRVHLDAFHIMGASVALSEGTLGIIGLFRNRDAAAFDEADRQRIDRFLPHLQSALRLRERLGAAAGQDLGFEILHTLEIGVVVARSDGSPVFANAAALASDSIAIGARHRPIAACDATSTRPLLALVRDAATGGPGGALVLQPPGQTPVAALVTPLPPGLADATAGHGLALIALRPLAGPRPAVAPRLRQLFGLTAAESELALALLGGQRPEEIAAGRGVKISTVRFQIRAILDKTGTRGQSDLVRLLGRISPFRDD